VTLTDDYTRVCAEPSDIYEHLPTFVQLVEDLDATQVIELGTRTGVSTIAWLYALEGRGHLWSVDVDQRPPIGEYDHWSFIHGDDTTIDVFAQLPSGVDIVFIDTSHAYKHTTVELSLYARLVRPGGRIVLHDTELPMPEGTDGPLFPVKRAVNEFCEANGLRWENHPNCWGLGIVYIP